MQLHRIILSTMLVISTALGTSVGDDDMVAYNKTMPDGSVLTYEMHKNSKFSPEIVERDGSDVQPLNATILPSTVFANSTAMSSNGTTPGPEELFQMIWTDKRFSDWKNLTYCGWNAPWVIRTPGPWVEDCIKLADIWAVMPGFWEVGDWGGDGELHRLVRYGTCELWIGRHDMRFGDVRVGNFDIVLFALQAAALGWLENRSRLAVMYSVQGFPACYDLKTGSRAGIEFQVIRNEHVPIPTNTKSWPSMTITPTATSYGHAYPTTVYTGD